MSDKNNGDNSEILWPQNSFIEILKFGLGILSHVHVIILFSAWKVQAVTKRLKIVIGRE